MLNKAKDLYKLKQRADLLKKKMAQVVVEVEVRGAKVTMQPQPDLRKALNKAVKKSQKEVAKKMRGDFSDFGLPGM